MATQLALKRWEGPRPEGLQQWLQVPTEVEADPARPPEGAGPAHPPLQPGERSVAPGLQTVGEQWCLTATGTSVAPEAVTAAQHPESPAPCRLGSLTDPPGSARQAPLNSAPCLSPQLSKLSLSCEAREHPVCLVGGGGMLRGDTARTRRVTQVEVGSGVPAPLRVKAMRNHPQHNSPAAVSK